METSAIVFLNIFIVWFGLVWGLSDKLFVLVFNEVRFAIA